MLGHKKKWKGKLILPLSIPSLSQGIPSKFLDCLAYDFFSPYNLHKGLARSVDS